MTERYDTGQRQLYVVPPPESSVATTVIIIIVIVIVVMLIVVMIILIVRRRPIGVNTDGVIVQCLTNADCSGNQVCSPAGRCVECLRDQNCPLAAPICDVSTNLCTQCQRDTDCPTGSSICNPATKRCVQCTSNIQCTVERPLCNPSNGSCVQCLTNGQCTAPAKCLNGSCCDSTPPVMTGLVSIAPATGALVRIIGTYRTSPGQPQAGQVAIAEISDRDDVPVRSSGGTQAVGTITVDQRTSNQTPRFYSDYKYQMRVRVSTPCGQTVYSNRLDTTIPLIQGAIIPVIDSVSANSGGVTILLSKPDWTNVLATWEPRVYITRREDDSNGRLDPNRAFIQENTIVSPKRPLLSVFAPWPSGIGAILDGNIFWIRVGGQTDFNAITLSFATQVIANPTLNILNLLTV